MTNFPCSMTTPEAAKKVMHANWRKIFGKVCEAFDNSQMEGSKCPNAKSLKSFCTTLIEARELAINPKMASLATSLGSWEETVLASMDSRHPVFLLAFFNPKVVAKLAEKGPEAVRQGVVFD